MESLKGSFLIASPGLGDPNFLRSVVFVAEHTEEGAFGLVVNNPGDARIADLWGSLTSEVLVVSGRTFVGGPVQKNAVLFLHGASDLAAETEPVVPGVYVGNEIEMLSELIRREAQFTEADPSSEARFRVFCGYSGWGAGQLDGELKAGGWLTCPATAEHVFATPPEKLWNVLLEALGGIYKFFALMPKNPEHN
jgi:putative transcriptional regulator